MDNKQKQAIYEWRDILRNRSNLADEEKEELEKVEEQIKRMEKEQECRALWRLIDGLAKHSDDWDLFCDCYKDNGVHEEDCLTVKIGKDINKLGESLHKKDGN